METFLQLVARDLYAKIGNDLSRTAIVFPNKRASLFFNEYLAAETDRPLWSPAYVSISELFRQLSPLKSGDPIRLVCELYKVFREETRSEETLDDFYFWGELLISDFDDVDKNLVDANKLFSNLQELKNIMDDYDFLDEEQEEAIRQFFQNFSIEKRTELKAKFISLWDKLGDIYHHYRRNLTELGIAYEGMMYRNVMEQLDTDRLRYDRYVFVGFNVLNRVETRFFQLLQDAGKAMFYWDYDVFYTRLPLEQKPPNCPKLLLMYCGSPRTYVLSPLLPKMHKPATCRNGLKIMRNRPEVKNQELLPHSKTLLWSSATSPCCSPSSTPFRQK